MLAPREKDPRLTCLCLEPLFALPVPWDPRLGKSLQQGGLWVYPWADQAKSENGILSLIFQRPPGVNKTRHSSSSSVEGREARGLEHQAGGDKGKVTRGKGTGDRARRTVLPTTTNAASAGDDAPMPGHARC